MYTGDLNSLKRSSKIKISDYQSDGTGRDNYIKVNNGGLTKVDSSTIINVKNGYYCRDKVGYNLIIYID